MYNGFGIQQKHTFAIKVLHPHPTYATRRYLSKDGDDDGTDTNLRGGRTYDGRRRRNGRRDGRTQDNNGDGTGTTG